MGRVKVSLREVDTVVDEESDVDAGNVLDSENVFVSVTEIDPVGVADAISLIDIDCVLVIVAVSAAEVVIEPDKDRLTESVDVTDRVVITVGDKDSELLAEIERERDIVRV